MRTVDVAAGHPAPVEAADHVEHDLDVRVIRVQALDHRGEQGTVEGGTDDLAGRSSVIGLGHAVQRAVLVVEPHGLQTLFDRGDHGRRDVVAPDDREIAELRAHDASMIVADQEWHKICSLSMALVG